MGVFALMMAGLACEGGEEMIVVIDVEPLSATDGVDGSRSRHRNVPHWVLSL